MRRDKTRRLHAASQTLFASVVRIIRNGSKMVLGNRRAVCSRFVKQGVVKENATA